MDEWKEDEKWEKGKNGWDKGIKEASWHMPSLHYLLVHWCFIVGSKSCNERRKSQGFYESHHSRRC